MYKFSQIEIESKKFNSIYEVQKDVELEKIRVSEGVVANKHDVRYTLGYEVEPGVVVPLCIKTQKDCLSSGISRYNEISPWKMGFNVSEDEAWIRQYDGIWRKVEELLSCKLGGTPLNNDKYVNNIGACCATGVLKIGSVYRQGLNYHLQTFLKECKYRKRDISFESLLSDDESCYSDEGYETVH